MRRFTGKGGKAQPALFPTAWQCQPKGDGEKIERVDPVGSGEDLHISINCCLLS